MRVLFTVWPAAAHLYPSVHLAWALRAAGHEVCVASRPTLTDTIAGVGLSAAPLVDEVELARSVGAGNPASEETLRTMDRITEAMAIGQDDPVGFHVWRSHRDYAIPAVNDLQPIGADPEGPQPVLDALVAFCRDWQPDLVLWDPTTPIGAVAARVVGAAHARLLWGLDLIGWSTDLFARRKRELAGALKDEDPIVAAVRPMAERYGLAVEDDLFHGQWTVDPMPAGLRLPTERRVVPMNCVPYTGSGAMPGWLHESSGCPRVALTLGASMRAFGKDSKPLIANLLDALGALDVEVVATLNKAQLEGIAHLPDNVRTVDYIPLTQLLPTCSAVIHHGGAGSMSAAAVAGIPQLVAIDDDNVIEGPVVGTYLTEAGAGLMVRHGEHTVEDMRAVVSRLLDDPSFESGAAALRGDVLGAPTPAEVVHVLERLTAHHRAATRRTVN
ncbi:nucleotide disphospho-sugar-binding domain-containing protein [Streptomyces sp. MP131-18]|uniref:nucleotide disphospho-sugar-binding domain-containing protein n=1 Tax=Streptomyces sp. MP131-18 TaxID=1857892 RepID=UPI00097C915C|nr:nucleotide disphospho-sugar-binding domain-containing protein [Streptomyces sp. MP131-18]ONK11272.1 Desosaminyl transferase EryCIII precursor [Streptomyces sp. MP131-18]